MLQLLNLKRLFSKRTKKTQETVASKPQTTRLNVEQLEDRVTPAKLDILSPSFAVGYAKLNSTTQMYSGALSGGTNIRDLATVNSSGYSLAKSYANLSYWNLTPQAKQLQLTSSANAQSSFKDAVGEAWTSDRSNGGLGWIPVKVNASTSSEYSGKPVSVSLTASYQGTRSGATASNFVQISVWQNGQTDLFKQSNLGTSQKTVTLNTTVGSVFYVHMHTYSYAQSASMAKGVATLNMTVR